MRTNLLTSHQLTKKIFQGHCMYSLCNIIVIAPNSRPGVIGSSPQPELDGRRVVSDLSSLQSGQNDPRVLHSVLDFPQEHNGFASIDETMIVSQSNVHHGSNYDLQKQRLLNVFHRSVKIKRLIKIEIKMKLT